MAADTVTVLISGFGLGLYVPGLLIAERLKRLGVAAETCVFETLIADKQEQVLKSRQACHRSFQVAQFSARVPMDLSKSMDERAVGQLLERWEEEGRSEFIALSGHWLHVLDRYRERVFPRAVHAEIVYVDCGLPPSWTSVKHYDPSYADRYREIWIYDAGVKRLNHPIVVADASPPSWDERERRLIVHGGGWGMGTYRTKIPELRELGFSLDIVAYELDEGTGGGEEDRFYMVDPAWTPWRRNADGALMFPPLGEIRDGRADRFADRGDRHALFDVTSRTMAIVGKPGAGTLIDSLASATPLVMLEPFGEHEKANAGLWQSLGFGIPYEEWRAGGFSAEVLESLHDRLSAAGRTSGTDYAAHYAKRRRTADPT
ncbi:UDP-glucuronosyltransferase [Cohnella suwonensis]|uniref:UDP-glucuronosyltransferase n=1 Tax=Cohnella suwonensis TaxID=696072 RepID=A0ABW0LQ99_9BACL